MRSPFGGVSIEVGRWRPLMVLAGLLLGQVPAIATEPGLDSRAPGTGTEGAEVSVEVLYATNRGRDDENDGPDAYSGDRGEPHYGTCEVVFTPIAVMGDIASRVPFYLPSESRKVKVAEVTDPETFWARLSERVSASRERAVVLFVHGYNYGFERTCRMGAELRRRLAGIAEVVLFSWPSNGNPADYLPDQVDVEWSVPFLAATLAHMRTRLGEEARLHVMAHSLGSRGTFFALQRLRSDLDARPLVDQLILLAPDFDSATFTELFPRLRPLSRHMTLYTSRNDTALAFSRQLNGHPRLGEAGDYLTLIEDMDTVDVSEAGRYQITGHEYHLYHPRVGADLVELVSHRRPAAEREGLIPRMRDGIRYWAIPATDQP